MMFSVSLALLGAGLGLVVEGNTPCPTVEQVGAALRPLLREEISGTDDRLVLSQVPHGLNVRLIDSHGDLLAQRMLPQAPGCTAQAHRVAVIASAWQARLSEEPLAPAPELPPSDANRDAEPESPDAEEAAERNARLWPAPAPQPVRHPNPAFLGLDYRLSFTPAGGVTSVLAIEGGAIWGRWGIQGGGWFEFGRTIAASQEVGELSFGRIAAEFGPTLVARSADPEIQVRVLAVGALLDASQTYFDPGIELGARVVPGQPPARVFIDVATILWPRFLGNVPGLPLSPFELFLSVGIFLGST
jgi:hypothetical protein